MVVPYAGASEIIAYFTTAPDPSLIAQVPPGARLNHTNFTLLYLAVAQTYQSQGIGTQILLYLIDIIISASETHPEFESLDLWPLDETASDWYMSRNMGFERVFPDVPLLSLSIDTMRSAAGLGPN